MECWEVQPLTLPSRQTGKYVVIWQAQEAAQEDMDLGVPDKRPARSHPKKKFKVDKSHPHTQGFTFQSSHS